MRIYSRAEVGLDPPRASLTPFQYVDGIIVHYVGSSYPFSTNPTLAQSFQSWRNIQHEAFQNTAEGYIDVQYNHAIDLAGNCLEGRGWGYKSGANGSANYNGHALAVCVLAGVGQAATPQARQALFDYQDEAEQHGLVTYIKPHSAVAPNGTACPGDIAPTVREMDGRLHGVVPPAPPKPKPKPKRKDMYIVNCKGMPAALVCGAKVRHFGDKSTLDQLIAQGVVNLTVDRGDYDHLTA